MPNEYYPEPSGSDSLYRLTVVFPHMGRDVQLAFDPRWDQARRLETFGLDNVKVEALGMEQALDAEGLAECWGAVWATPIP